MNPLSLEILLQEKRRDLLNEADRQRLISIYNAANPGRREKFRLALGDVLIQLGKKIQGCNKRQLALENDLCRE